MHMSTTSAGRSTRNRSALRRLFATGLAVTAAAGLVAIDPLTTAPVQAMCPVNDPDCDPWGEPDPEPAPEPTTPRPHRPGNAAALVVSMGDSYASGQGAPDRNGEWWDNGYHLDKKCHRSNWGASVRAVSGLRASNPYAEGIDHVNVTCTGATVRARYGYDKHYFTGGLLTAQGPTEKEAQFHQVNLAVGGRPIDALTISIGGNDVRFADIVKTCGSGTNCADYYGETATDLRRDLVDLRNLYSELIVAVQGDAYGNGRALVAPVKNVFVTEYPDPSIDADGTRCHNEGGWGLDKMTSAEASWAKTNVIDRVNSEIRSMVVRANNANRGTRWYSVPAPSFSGRGFCSPSRWVNNWHDSQDLQHDDTGTMHPNASGWTALGEALRGQLNYLNTVPYSR